MTDTDDKKKILSLSTQKLGLKKPADASQIRQSFSYGRSKTVAIEVKRKRPTFEAQGRGPGHTLKPQGLSQAEWDNRLKVVQEAMKSASEVEAQLQKEREERAELEALRLAALEQQRQQEEEAKQQALQKQQVAQQTSEQMPAPTVDESSPVVENTDKSLLHRPTDFKARKSSSIADEDDAEEKFHRAKRTTVKAAPVRRVDTDIKGGRHDIRQKLHGLSVKDVINTDDETEKTRKYGSRRFREKAKRFNDSSDQKMVTREVIIPEIMTVQELANRMAVRGAEVIKKLMAMGTMLTITQNIDADTAELIVAEFGHTAKRIADSDIEIGMMGGEDIDTETVTRPPVVTVMGHVDHGKTSLLDAIRKTDIVTGEAGGITQHIGAYQVTMPTGKKITFVDTPGHAAFTEMRARGANVTDIVILVVAADDGIMEQTIEAIHHARAAKVPIIVAINKIDKPTAQPDRVRTMLLQQEIVLEDLGGEVMSVEVSAKTGLNIDKLEEIILLQAELLDLRANPNREAKGVVVEAKIERGRGPIATVLVQRGTLKVGDIFVAGSQWGRVRALVDDKGKSQTTASLSQPIEVIGFSGTPSPGDDFSVQATESRAREIAEYRAERLKNKTVGSPRLSFETLMSQAQGQKKEVAVVVKSDVQGSLEAIVSSLNKLATEEVSVRILYAGVGGINESDIVLARASQAHVIGFNVRANPQAREAAYKNDLEIRYYSIIYNVIDDIKAVMGGLLAPTLQEKFLGYADIRQVFNITKVGKIAGCYVTQGLVQRGAKVRLLRDNIVIHEGNLKTLKRMKEEVKEVKENYECGMAFENYQDIREGDTIECFEIQKIARVLA